MNCLVKLNLSLLQKVGKIHVKGKHYKAVKDKLLIECNSSSSVGKSRYLVAHLAVEDLRLKGKSQIYDLEDLNFEMDELFKGLSSTSESLAEFAKQVSPSTHHLLKLSKFLWFRSR